ncbi:MAG: HAD family hydrolase [Verrucomicrobiota bacterium]
MPITTVAFDADDTLWHNENLFEESHRRYCELLSRYHDAETVERTLFATEMRNLELLGYGIKAHALSSIETAIELTNGQIGADEIRGILDIAKDMLRHPVELLPGVREVLARLEGRHRLLLITKGDLLDQERKIEASGLAAHFAHAEVVSNKDVPTYARLFARLGVDPASLLMVGNSLKSDILPILEMGGHGVHIPYRVTWAAEHAEVPAGEAAARFHVLERITGLPALLERLAEDLP